MRTVETKALGNGFLCMRRDEQPPWPCSHPAVRCHPQMPSTASLSTSCLTVPARALVMSLPAPEPPDPTSPSAQTSAFPVSLVHPDSSSSIHSHCLASNTLLMGNKARVTHTVHGQHHNTHTCLLNPQNKESPGQNSVCGSWLQS
jgi:hypothetical protein